MKIIITEDQYKILTESKNLEPAQNLIDMSFKDLKDGCENNFIDPIACDEMDSIEEIKVVESKKGSTITRNEKTNFWLIDVDIHYTSITHVNFDNLIYQIQWKVREIAGVRNIVLTIRDTINKRKNFDW